MLARRSAAFGMPCPLRNRLQPARAAASSFSVTRPILSSEVMECGDQQWVALRPHWTTREGRYPLLSTFNLYRTGGLAASPREMTKKTSTPRKQKQHRQGKA